MLEVWAKIYQHLLVFNKVLYHKGGNTQDRSTVTNFPFYTNVQLRVKSLA